MILNEPFKISARLLPALQIGDSWLSLDTNTGTFYLDTPDFEMVEDRYHHGVSVTYQEWFEGLLSFLGAAAESQRYVNMGYPSDNKDLFEPHVMVWCLDHSSEIDELQCWVREVSEECES